MYILYTLLYVLIGYAMYMFVLVASGMCYRPRVTNADRQPKIKILLPAYRPDQVFFKVMDQLKWVTQGRTVDVFILFQHADFKYCQRADELDFSYEIKSFDHLSGNSYQHALRHLAKHHVDQKEDEYVMILDKDNLIAADFFQELEKIDLAGFDVVQSVRRPLEVGKGLQVFDALSERLNDLMLRAGKCFWGGTLELSGSAALIKTALFQKCILGLDASAPGFDKNFMVNLLTQGAHLKTMFAENLAVYEEKTAATENYQSQRLRWFGEQYYNALFKAGKLWGQVLTGNLKCLDYWVSLIRPPRIVLFVVSFLLMMIDLWDAAPGLLSVAFVLNCLTMLMVSFPYLDHLKALEILKGGWRVLSANFICAMNSLRKKNLGTFIHTR